jgi:hypothetical protein
MQNYSNKNSIAFAQKPDTQIDGIERGSRNRPGWLTCTIYLHYYNHKI